MKIFVSYSSHDRNMVQTLMKYLQPHLPQHVFWVDHEIQMGQGWHETIQRALDDSDAAILCVSSFFLSSSYVRENELAAFFKRQKEQGYPMLPVLMRDANFRNFGELAQLQFFKTYGEEYDFYDEWRDKVLPFEEIAEVDRPKPKLLNRYAKKLADKIETALQVSATESASAPTAEASNSDDVIPDTGGQRQDLDAFKAELKDHVDEMEFDVVFEKIKKSDYKYQKFSLNHLQSNFSFQGGNPQLVSQLKTFIGTLKEK